MTVLAALAGLLALCAAAWALTHLPDRRPAYVGRHRAGGPRMTRAQARRVRQRETA